MTLFGPALMPGDPFEIVSAPMEPPGAEFLLGTDYLGRDVLTGLDDGRATLLVGVVAAVLSVLIGVTVGALAGYWRLDRRGADARHRVLPGAAHAAVRHGAGDAVLAVAGDDRHRHRRGQLTGTARLARGEFLRLKRREYVLAERVIGRRAHHLARDPAQRAGAPLIVSATLAVGTAVLFEAGLSFLGWAIPTS